MSGDIVKISSKRKTRLDPTALRPFIQPEPDAQELYASGINVDVLGASLNKGALREGIPACIVTIGGFLAAGIFTVVDVTVYHLDFGQKVHTAVQTAWMLGGTMPALFASVMGMGVGMFRTEKYSMNSFVRERTLPILGTRFSRWLQKRYNVEFDSGQEFSTDLVDMLSYPQDAGTSATFRDVHGSMYRIQSTGPKTGCYVEKVVDQGQVPASALAPVVNQAAQAVAEQLGGESALLYADIDRLLVRLDVSDLDVAQQHIIKRVQIDRQDTVLAYQRFAEFGDASQDVNELLAATLNDLRNELLQIMESQRLTAMDTLLAQRAYVQARQQENGDGALALRLSELATAVPEPIYEVGKDIKSHQS